LVKSGALQTDCGCCGGWYCCPSVCSAWDTVSSVVVTITPEASVYGANYSTVADEGAFTALSPSLSYHYASYAADTAALAGSFALERITAAGVMPAVWSKTLPPPIPGCYAPKLTLTAQSLSSVAMQWTFRATYTIHTWETNVYHRTLDGSKGYKSLADMKCQSAGGYVLQSAEPFQYINTNTCSEEDLIRQFQLGVDSQSIRDLECEGYTSQEYTGLARSSGAFSCSPTRTGLTYTSIFEIPQGFPEEIFVPPPLPNPLVTQPAMRDYQFYGSRRASVTIAIS